MVPNAERDGIDRRIHPRIPARVEVRFQERAQAAKAFRAFSLNFSVGGLCLKTDKTYELGATLEMWIQIDEELHQLRGKVAWVRSGAVGVRFEIGNDQDREAVARIMSYVRQAA